jgi:hypothetical protein
MPLKGEHSMQKSISKLSLLTIPVFVAGGLLLFASAGRVNKTLANSARADDRRGDHDDDDNTKPCSNRTIRGTYGLTLTGEILGPGIQLRGVVLQHYDGRGKVTQIDHVLDNGNQPREEWTPGSGTYTVNPDCTGFAVVTIPGVPLSPVAFHFVVVDGGKEVRQVVDANAVIATGNRID